MRPPLTVREMTPVEQAAVAAGLRSPDAFVLRRCQILLASARGLRAAEIARTLSVHEQTVRFAIRAFNATGLAALAKGSSRPHVINAAFDVDAVEALCRMLEHSPREYGKRADEWSLDLAAQVSYEQGITTRRVTGETVRATLERVGIPWQRAKGWRGEALREQSTGRRAGRLTRSA